MGIDRGKTIRTWRLALTCIFLFFISWYYKIPESSWSLVTIWFVMYEYTTVGGVLNKSMLRFSGTVISALYGITIIYLCGNDPFINIFALVAGLFFYTYWFMGNDKTYTGTIGAVTLTIVLLNYNDIEVAILRVFNVLLGIIASVFMIRFFYPQYARNHLIETQINWFNQLEELINEYLDSSKDQPYLKIRSYDLEHLFLANLANYSKLVGEAKMETKMTPFFTGHCLIIKEQFQLLFRLFSMFIATLSTDEVRAHPWVMEQLRLIRNKIEAMNAQLLGVESNLSTLPSPVISSDENNGGNLVEIMLTNKKTIEQLLQEINEILTVLSKEIQQSIKMYEHYNCSIQASLRT